MKSEKIILTGKSGSGKDYLLRGLIKKGLKYLPKFTTRPRRALEKEGVDYNYVTNEQFEILNKSGEIKTHQKFLINDNIWYYGITKYNFDNSQVFIMTPYELSQISEEDLSKAFIVYIDIDIDTRRKRISNRNDSNDSIERRLHSDEMDFENFKKYDLKITDPEFECDWIYDLMN